MLWRCPRWRAQGIAPVRKEKFLLRWEECVRLSYNRAQSGRHLDRYENENDHPGIESSRRLGLVMGKPRIKKLQSEHGRNEPENQVQNPHPDDRLRGLRKQPRDRRKPD